MAATGGSRLTTGPAAAEIVGPSASWKAVLSSRESQARLFHGFAVVLVVGPSADISPAPGTRSSWGRGPDVKGWPHAVSWPGEANPLHWASPMISGTEGGRIFGAVGTPGDSGEGGELAALRADGGALGVALGFQCGGSNGAGGIWDDGNGEFDDGSFNRGTE